MPVRLLVVCRRLASRDRTPRLAGASWGMVTGGEDSPQGHDQPEQPASPDLEQAVPVQPRCRWWSSRRQWPPLVEEAYTDFKYQALHVPHFISSLAVLGLVGLYGVLFSENATLHGTLFPVLYWWQLALSTCGGLLSVAACLLFRHAPRRTRRFAVPLHMLMGLYWSFVLSLDPHRKVAMAFPRSTYSAELAKVTVRVRDRVRVRVRDRVRVRVRVRDRIRVRVRVRVRLRVRVRVRVRVRAHRRARRAWWRRRRKRL